MKTLEQIKKEVKEHKVIAKRLKNEGKLFEMSKVLVKVYKLNESKKRLGKKQSVSVLKKALWKVFSEFIRKRDSNKKGMGKCISCGTIKDRKQMQAGHYIPRTYSIRYFDPVNVNSQCFSCNIMKKGNYVEYREGMINKWGLDMVTILEEGRHKLKSWKSDELQSLIDVYKSKPSQTKEK